MRLALLAMLLCLPSAAAHADSGDWAGSWELAPGERVEVVRPVHWHRVFGSWEASAPLAFEVAGQSVAQGRNVRFDHLVDCCDDLWTDVTFSLHNPGQAQVTVTASFHFVHDNLAVVVDDSEEGAWWQTLLIFVLLLGVPALLARRSAGGDARRWLVANRVLHAGAWALALALAVTGIVRFASGPVVGSMGATAGARPGFGEFFNLHAVLMLLLMALWGAGYACLAAARRRGAMAWDGALYLGGLLLVAAAVMVEVGGNAITAVLLVVPAAIIIADQWSWSLRPGRKGLPNGLRCTLRVRGPR